jgi:FMN phosphatase YigB (HAD superfamily)
VTSGSRRIEAITFDFGNTLVPVSKAALESVVRATADAASARLGPFERDSFLSIWAEERERQFREDVPEFREVDISRRSARVLARLRGTAAPANEERWDDTIAAASSTPDEIAWLIDTYSAAFVDRIPPPPAIRPMLQRLALTRTVAILSNWPLAATIDHYSDVAGWSPFLRAIVVSQRVGTIKPRPAIFELAEELIGAPGAAILHVGDDWDADIVGAMRAGWRAAYVRGRPSDSPLPSSPCDETVRPEFELDDVTDLPARLDA